MWRTGSIVLGTLLWSSSIQAQCLTPLDDLQQTTALANEKLTLLAKQADDLGVKSETASKAVSRAISDATQAHAAQKASDLERAITDLGAAQKSYDALSASQDELMIARLETERLARGAKQALAETLLAYQRQGNTLISAVERARRGEIVPSLTDLLSCEQGECGRIADREQAALIALGAIADTLDPQAWPIPGRECDFTLISASTAHNPLLRNLRAAQQLAERGAQEADAALRVARQNMTAALMERGAAVMSALDAHATPAANSHADEFLGMSIERLSQHGATAPTALAAYKAADVSARIAKEKAVEAAALTLRHLNYWDDIGRAVVAVSVRLERKGSDIAQNDLEAAALAVMGANPTGKAKACLLERSAAQKTPRAFAPIPAPQC